MEDFYPNKNHGPDSGIGSDNGDKRLSTTEVRVETHKNELVPVNFCLPRHSKYTLFYDLWCKPINMSFVDLFIYP